MRDKITGKDLIITLGILLFVGLLAGRTLFQSMGIILMVFGFCFVLVGIVLSLIYFSNK